MSASAELSLHIAPVPVDLQPVPLPENASNAPQQANRRDDRDFSRARRHSRMVRGLRQLLPISALVVIGIFIGSTLFTYSPVSELSIDSAGLKDGKLVMEQPKMAGFDKNNRPYDVSATKAIQDVSKPGMIELVSIDAKLPMDATSFADVDAQIGFYDTNNETLVLKKDVTIKGARGMDILLEEANFNMKTGGMTSDMPVVVNSKDINISADSVSVEKGGQRIVFKKRVKMTITRPLVRGE